MQPSDGSIGVDQDIPFKKISLKKSGLRHLEYADLGEPNKRNLDLNHSRW